MRVLIRAAWRRSCVVGRGQSVVGLPSSSVPRNLATVGLNTRVRKVAILSTPPPGAANTSSSRPLPAIRRARSSVRNRGNGTDRRSWLFGVDETNLPLTSVTDRRTCTRLRSMSKSATARAAISPYRKPV